MKDLPYIDWRLIDPQIVPVIMKLNKKGYFTVFCCESHSDDPDIIISRRIDTDDCDSYTKEHLYHTISTEHPEQEGRCQDYIIGHEIAEQSFLENGAYIKFGFGYEKLWYEFATVYNDFDCVKAINNMINTINSNEKYKEIFKLEINYESFCLRVKPLTIQRNIMSFLDNNDFCINLMKERKKEVLIALTYLSCDLPAAYKFKR